MNHKVSPSQIAEARRCLRSWWWQSVKGYRKPDTPSTQFGSEVHATIERYILEGYWPDTATERAEKCGATAYEALARTVRDPDPRKGDLVEADWSLPSGEYPLASRGRIDLVMPRENTLVDWKTTSSKAWMKTPAMLAIDPQVILYTDALVSAGVLQLPVDFLHVYTLTKGAPEAHVVRTKVDAQTLSIGRAGIVDTMQEMVDVLHMDDPYFEDIPGNILACGDFGGCFHRDRCFVRQSTSTEDENMGNFAEQLAARRAAQNGNAVVTVQAQEPAACVPVAAAGINPPEGELGPLDVAEQLAAAAEVSAPVKATKSTKRTRRTTESGTMLLIGAMPLVWDGEPYGPDGWTLGDTWLNGFAQTAADSLKVSHWAIADYGKGKAAVVALVAEACRKGDVPRYLMLDRRNPLADACCEVLIPHYNTVFVKMS